MTTKKISDRCRLASAVVDGVCTYAEYLVARGLARKNPIELLADVETDVLFESSIRAAVEIARFNRIKHKNE